MLYFGRSSVLNYLKLRGEKDMTENLRKTLGIPETFMANRLHGIGDLRYESVPMFDVGDGEVLVKVKNCGVCGSDIGRVFIDGTCRFPLTIGHEFAGQVIYDPSGEFSDKKVAVFPLLPCFNCESCKDEHYAQCENYDYYGSRRDGGFGEYLAVKKFNLVPLPDNVPYEEGAMCEPASVALHAVKTAGIKENDTVLIAGAGTIGLIEAMWAKSFGAKRVMFLEIMPQKAEFARKMGFEMYEEGVKVDVGIEASGASPALGQLIMATRPYGHIVLMGNPSRPMQIDKPVYSQILRRELTLHGIWNELYGTRENDWRDTVKAVSEGRLVLKPLITHRYPLSGLNDALRMMHENSEFYCKVMVECG